MILMYVSFLLNLFMVYKFTKLVYIWVTSGEKTGTKSGRYNRLIKWYVI